MYNFTDAPLFFDFPSRASLLTILGVDVVAVERPDVGDSERRREGMRGPGERVATRSSLIFNS